MPHHARPLPLGLDEYELILDSLKGMDYEIRRDILQAICLTHRSLVPLCQKRLFSTIKFSSKKADAFLNILSVSPYLADYIRNLTLNLQLDKEPSPTNSQDVTNTAQCLEKLNNLISLTVLGRRDWHTIDLQTSNAILRLMLSPNLNTLGLRDLQNFPRHGLSSLKQSRYLNFISFGAITIDPPATVGLPSTSFEFDNTLGPANPTFAQIASFSGSADAIDALVGGPDSRCRSEPVFDFTRLRSLYSELGSIPDAEANNMLIGRSACLEDVFCTSDQETLESNLQRHFRRYFERILSNAQKIDPLRCFSNDRRGYRR
ncbi:hypothetical protein BDN70DRAFT_719569 [Pholiota conissans]|uniref:Uncharacterized protein n=1 Tax=Pholiota conissans TaxID=109636 RepID=A0A9P5Z295_9AGAR|nr:hypothetical protein BDN70DRAFT_719569 [Pholiota conissans]